MKCSEVFLGWLRTRSAPAKIGQIRIVAETDGWVIRHVEDDDHIQPDSNWRAAREWAKTAGDGSYRPLKGENNLARGRALGPLSDGDLIEALNALYPTAVANGVLYEEGRLPVTSFAETAGRQTGMYRVVATIQPEPLDAVVREICEARCLKIRLWAPRPQEVHRAESVWPLLCPEACNLFIAACRAKIKGRMMEKAED